MQAKSNFPEPGANGQGDAKPATSAVSREIGNVLADAEDLVKATTSFTGEDLARVRDQLAKGIAAARQSMEEMGGAIADGARKSAATTNAYVHEQPWIAIGAGVAAGFLLGVLVARRS
jgi:ElaB/YqjD/DUF883 family membrane-anchored ribosome-binding protein